MKNLKWGIIGTGKIAQRFAFDLKNSDKLSIVAVASRSISKAKEFAEKYEISKFYGSYEDLLLDNEVQVVYISLPNHLHAEWSMKCAKAGKHILCEKPITTNAGQLEKVLEVVKKYDVFFMEAFMYRCHPQWKVVKKIIADGVIGDIKIIKSSFAYNMGLDLANIRLSNIAAGGGLMDVGCYCVSFSRFIAEEEPIKSNCVGHIGNESRVDQQAAGILKFPSGIVASFECGTQVDIQNSAKIYGSKGSISIENPWSASKGSTNIIVTTDREEIITIESNEELYTEEALNVAKFLDDRQSPAMCWNDSIGQMNTMDMLRKDMGLEFDMEKVFK